MTAEFGRRRPGPLGRFAVVVLSLLVGVIAFAAYPAAAHASTTTVDAATLTYDVSAVPRVYAHEFLSADVTPTQLSDVREPSASPLDGARGTFTTPSDRVVATETEVVQRWMSEAELKATEDSELVRGGREGTHYVTDSANSDPLRARQRLSLPQTPEVRVDLEVPKGAFSSPTRVDPDFNMPGGGMQRTATGDVPCRVVCVWRPK